jgi:hypothetical protein
MFDITRVAYYDPVILGMGVIACFVFLAPFKMPRRERVGYKDEEGKQETLTHYIKETEQTFTPLPNTFCGISFNPDGIRWCGDKLKCCWPFDHQAWFQVGALCCMGVPFTVHFVYYFVRIGTGSLDKDNDITSIVFLSWGCAMAGAFLCVIKGYFSDVGFAAATWATVAIWMIKIINVDLTKWGELALVSGITVMSLMFLSVCIFCGVCGLCVITCLTCKCCRDDISHKVAKLFIRFNLHATIAIAISLSFSIVFDGGFGPYLTNDRDWLLERAYIALGIFAFGVVYRLLFWHKGHGLCGLCTFFSYCYEHFYDKDKHVFVRDGSKYQGCCFCTDDEEATAEERKPMRKPPPAPSKPQRIVMDQPKSTGASHAVEIRTDSDDTSSISSLSEEEADRRSVPDAEDMSC